jgi:hypothetical protein
MPVNLRWLLGNFTDPQYRLPVREQFRVSQLAHDRYVSGRVFIVRTLIITAPILVAFLLVDDLMAALGLAGQSKPN